VELGICGGPISKIGGFNYSVLDSASSRDAAETYWSARWTNHSPPRTNTPATIEGIHFSGHAIDEMQGDGIPLSAVNRALRIGAIEPGKFGRTIFYDAINKN
jgi:hypothetical protein